MGDRRTGTTPLRGRPLDENGRIEFEQMAMNVDERKMRAFRLQLRRLAKRWRDSGDRQQADELDELLDE